MSIAGLSPKFAFGISTKPRQNVLFIDELTVVFPSGGNLILYNIEHKSQKFVPLSEYSQGVSALTMTANRKFLAIAEVGKLASISIYDTITMRKKKTLSVFESTAKEYSLLAFSNDCKNIAAISKDGDVKISFWFWEKSKLFCHQIVPMNLNGVISELAFHPTENNVVSIVGDNVFRTLRYHDGAFKATSSHRQENKAYSSHTWLTNKLILLGTKEGKFFVSDDLEMHADSVLVSDNDILSPIRTIVPYGDAFIIGNSYGSVNIFERIEDKSVYRKTKEILTNDQEIAVHSIALSPTGENFVVTLENNQIFGFSLTSAELLKENSTALFSFSYHHGPITGLDTCIRKPIVATCSTDKSVRIWNYLDNNCQFVKYFNEDICSVSLHPSGHLILLGFQDKLKLMSLLIDDIRQVKDFNVRSCRESKFSNGGQYFAAINSTTVFVYSTWSYELISTLKGHIGKIKSLFWSSDDTRMITAGMDGAIYEWDVIHGKRLSENVIKSCSYYSAVMAGTNEDTIYATGSDARLRVIQDSQVTKEFNFNIPGSQLFLAQSIFLSAMTNGQVKVIKFPLDDKKLEFQDHMLHSSTISKLRVSFDNHYMFTGSDDGTVYISKLTDREGNGRRLEDYGFSSEILVNKADIDEKMNLVSDLQTRVEELKLENEYQLRLKDLSHKEKIQEVIDKMQMEIENFKINIASLHSEKDQMELKHAEGIAEIKEKCQNQIREIETINAEKLLMEYEKYTQLQGKLAQTQLNWDNAIKLEKENTKQIMSEMQDAYEAKLGRKDDEIAELREEMKKQLREFELSVKDTEEDADTEIINIQMDYENKLKNEQELNSRIAAENSLLRKKFTTFQKEISDYRAELQKTYENEKKLYKVITNLEKDMAILKKEVDDRDEAIDDKERRIYDLKRKNQELDKFKFVLDHKIIEMKHQIEPRDEAIINLNQKIKNMDLEIQEYNERIKSKDHKVSELKEKLRTVQERLGQEKESNFFIKSFSNRLKDAIYAAVQNNMSDPKLLNSSIIQIYQQFCKAEEESLGLRKAKMEHKGDDATNDELMRQRNHLEKTIHTLQKKVEKTEDNTKRGQQKFMQENSKLLNEINNLRKSNISLHRRLLEYQQELSRYGNGNMKQVRSVSPTKKERQIGDDVEQQAISQTPPSILPPIPTQL